MLFSLYFSGYLIDIYIRLMIFSTWPLPLNNSHRYLCKTLDLNINRFYAFFISLYIFTHKKQIHHLVWFIRFFQSQNLRLYYPWGDKKEYLDHTHTHAHTIKWTTLWVQHPLSLFGLMILSLSWSHIKHMPLMDGWMDGKIDRCFFVCVDVYFCVFLCRSVYWIIAWSRWALLRVSQQRLAPAEPSAPVTWPYLWTCYSTASLMITHLPPTW